MLGKFVLKRIKLHSTPFVSFVRQYDVIDDSNQKVQAEIHDGIDPNQFVDAAFPSAAHARIHVFHLPTAKTAVNYTILRFTHHCLSLPTYTRDMWAEPYASDFYAILCSSLESERKLI